MAKKESILQLNIIGQCREHGLSLWQCPQFLFLIMGIIIITSTLVVYFIGNLYIDDPYIVSLIVILIGGVLLIIAFIITKSFERLAEASRMKSEFVSIVSHQLRSPLSNLKWVTDLLMSGRIAARSEKQLEYFKILKENSDRMIELVADLLTVSKIEQQELPLRKKEMSIKDLVEREVREMEVFAKASNVRLEFKSEKTLPQILADPDRLKLVIDNLLDNAIRYNPAKGEIEINLKKKSNDIYFEIKDNGVGISKKDQKYMFQKFFRSENVIKHQTEGSGLGLYIAKSIIEKSGGKIGFQSQEGIGSTFWFTLPIKS